MAPPARLRTHSPNDVPPEPQRNVSIAAVRGAVRPSIHELHAPIYLAERFVITQICAFKNLRTKKSMTENVG